MHLSFEITRTWSMLGRYYTQTRKSFKCHAWMLQICVAGSAALDHSWVAIDRHSGINADCRLHSKCLTAMRPIAYWIHCRIHYFSSQSCHCCHQQQFHQSTKAPHQKNVTVTLSQTSKDCSVLSLNSSILLYSNALCWLQTVQYESLTLAEINGIYTFHKITGFQTQLYAIPVQVLYALALIPVGFMADKADRPRFLAAGLTAWSILTVLASKVEQMSSWLHHQSFTS